MIMPSRSFPIWSLLICLAILLAGCTASLRPDVDSPTPASFDETQEENLTQAVSTGMSQTTSPTSTATTSPTATPQPQELSEYDLTAILDYARRHVSVTAQINYFNNTAESLDELLLVVDANRFPGAFRLEEIAWEDGQPVSGFTLSGIELHLPLRGTLAPGERLSLKMNYELNLPQVKGPFGYTTRQVNISDWYPYVPPFLPDSAWIVREPAFVGEHLAFDMANFRVNLQLASPVNQEGFPLVLAASSLPEENGEWRRYRLERARNFVWSVSHLYQVQEAVVDGVTVLAYAFPYNQDAENTAFQETIAALRLFNEIFSPYPYESLSVVEGDFLDGMEYSGLFFLSHAFYDYHTGNPMGNLTIITAHEVAHQWWYGLVANDQALEPWLDEALCTYSEILFYENVYPDLAQWWWDNRITFHQPTGWVDSTIYNTAGFYPYRDAVYLRGALFLGEVRDLLGDEAFFAFLRDYLERFTGQVATGDDFFAVLAEHTSADLSSLTGEYFQNR
jgi:hypothetical protein